MTKSWILFILICYFFLLPFFKVQKHGSISYYVWINRQYVNSYEWLCESTTFTRHSINTNVLICHLGVNPNRYPGTFGTDIRFAPYSFGQNGIRSTIFVHYSRTGTKTNVFVVVWRFVSGFIKITIYDFFSLNMYTYSF